MDDRLNLKSKIVSGVFWKGLERVCARMVSLVVSIVLARILFPEDYSVVSIATIFFAFCDLFISGGINSSLIQKKNADTLDYATVLTINLIFAAIAYGIMFFAAPAISIIYKKESVTPIIRVMALTFFLNGYKAVLSAKIYADLKFQKFFWATIVGTVVSAGVGILLAIKGAGPWALVAQQMTNSAIDLILLTVTTRLVFIPRFSYERFKSLFSYGGKIFLASILSTIYDQCKPLIVGLKYSSADLAYYNKGMSFPNIINAIGTDTLSSTLFPVLVKVQDDKEKILNMTRRQIQLSSFMVFPMMFGMFAISENFVRVVLTDKWMPIVPFMQIFCVSYALDLIQVGNLQAIKALGRSDYILKIEVVKKVSYFIIIAVFVVLSDSALMLAFSCIVCSVVATLVNTFPNQKLIGYRYSYLLSDILPNMVSAVIMGVIVYAMNDLPINMYLLLILQVITGILVYLFEIIIFKNKNYIYLKSSMKRSYK